MPDIEEKKYCDVLARIEWHCPGRHGVIRSVTQQEWPRVSDALEYYYCAGRKGCWARRVEKGIWDIEFCHQAKVFPPPRHPWEWCGETVLFKEEQARRQAERKLAQRFKVGDTVYFTYQGVEYKGLITGGRSRATVVVPGNTGKFYIPYGDLRRESELADFD